MTETRQQSIEITIVEDEDSTEATATTKVRGRSFSGRGRARRNPSDPNIPIVGEELAIARALSELAHALVGAAADAIERFEGHPVSLNN